MKAVCGALSPNIEKDDAYLALKLLFRPWRWRKGKDIAALENDFAAYLGIKHAFTFNSGRSALMAILQSLDLPAQSQVLVSGFTCAAAVNPIRWSQLLPIFADIGEDLNISLDKLAQKIKADTRVLLVQPTFGLPIDMRKIKEIAEKNQLIIIEDVAHALGAQSRGQKLGTFGRAAFFSLGRDKVISAVTGGIAVTDDEKLAKKIRSFQKQSSLPSFPWIAQQLLHPILTYFLILPNYQRGEWGRRMLLVLQKLGILTKAVHKKEKQGEKPAYLPSRMPNVLAVLGRHQFKKLGKFNQHRRKMAQIYDQKITARDLIKPPMREGRIYLKYPLLLSHQPAAPILAHLRKKKIFLYDGWQNSPIVPSDTKLEKIGYTFGECPVSESISQRLINLPTHINVSPVQAKWIASQINEFISGHE